MFGLGGGEGAWQGSERGQGLVRRRRRTHPTLSLPAPSVPTHPPAQTPLKISAVWRRGRVLQHKGRRPAPRPAAPRAGPVAHGRALLPGVPDRGAGLRRGAACHVRGRRASLPAGCRGRWPAACRPRLPVGHHRQQRFAGVHRGGRGVGGGRGWGARGLVATAAPPLFPALDLCALTRRTRDPHDPHWNPNATYPCLLPLIPPQPS